MGPCGHPRHSRRPPKPSPAGRSPWAKQSPAGPRPLAGPPRPGAIVSIANLASWFSSPYTLEESLKEEFSVGPPPLDRLIGSVKRGEEDRALSDGAGGPGRRTPAGRFVRRGA